MVDFNKRAAVLGIYAEGIKKPRIISQVIKERFGVDVKASAVSMVLYHHRRRRRKHGVVRDRSEAARKAWDTRRSKLKVIAQSAFESVTGTQLIAAVTVVNTIFGGDARLALDAIALAQRSGLCKQPVSNEG
jgi:hypothetical protein